MTTAPRPLGHFAGTGVLLRAETAQILRSPAMWVLAGVVALSAVLSPPTARYLTEILSAAVDPALAEALGAALAEPTWRDSYGEWLNNLNQLVVFALIIVAAITLTGELISGSAAFVLTRHVGRAGYLTAKAVVFAGAFLVITLAGALLTWAGTALLFDGPPLGTLVIGTLVWWLGALLIFTVIVAAAAASASMAISVGAGFLAYVALLILGAWPAAADYSPAGMNSLAGALIADASAPDVADVAWPVCTTLLACLVLTVVALETFKRKELR